MSLDPQTRPIPIDVLTRVILVAEVARVAALHAQVAEAEAAHAVDRCTNRMLRAVAVYGGRLVRQGSERLTAVFVHAEAALQAACEMHERVGALPPMSGIKLDVRAAIHRGKVVRDGDDFYGEGITLAARMADAAEASQVLISREAVEALPQMLRPAVCERPPLRLEGSVTPVGVFDVLINDAARMASSAVAARLAPAPLARLRLSVVGGESMVVDATHSVRTVGRDVDNALMVRDARASRRHARIERRRDIFVLIDVSMNGTYVTFEGETEIQIKGEEVELGKRGRFCLGRSAATGAPAVEFEILDSQS